ncbi:hypothetical protein RRG08_048576 [Elysia crispata]|uniref:Uncharacterized protein n=1 Tax=Elysia crispata TaxID=231223 RepID=A0AAE1B563_9GAST|nr:hypothetical protein RRG08_048576 [Elysia crispata]
MSTLSRTTKLARKNQSSSLQVQRRQHIHCGVATLADRARSPTPRALSTPQHGLPPQSVAVLSGQMSVTSRLGELLTRN